MNKNSIYKKLKLLVFLFLIPVLFFVTDCKKNDSVDGGNGVFRDVTPAEANDLIQQNQGNANFIILDVRTRSEYNSGYISGAQNIDYYASDFRSQLDALNKNPVYLVYCRSGNRSASTIQIMRELNFAEVYNMVGGINNWISTGLPVVQPTF